MVPKTVTARLTGYKRRPFSISDRKANYQRSKPYALEVHLGFPEAE